MPITKSVFIIKPRLAHLGNAMPTNAPNLLIHAKTESNIFARVSPNQVGWERLNMIAMALDIGKKFTLTTQQYEYCAIILGGVCDIRTSRGEFLDVGRRTDVFTGMPYAIYLPPNTDFEIESLSDDFQFASCWATAKTERAIRLITPNETKMNLHAVGRISTQTNTILSGEFSVWETYVPSTNWSHFPPRRFNNTETIFLCKQDRLSGFGLHRIYSEDESVDVAMTSQHNDVVIVPPNHYHTMTSSPIGTTYVLGMSHSTDNDNIQDKRYAWYSKVYEKASLDPRLPIVDIGMEPPQEE
jgi:5-deoxy-glucuronate isomerase